MGPSVRSSRGLLSKPSWGRSSNVGFVPHLGWIEQHAGRTVDPHFRCKAGGQGREQVTAHAVELVVCTRQAMVCLHDYLNDLRPVVVSRSRH